MNGPVWRFTDGPLQEAELLGQTFIERHLRSPVALSRTPSRQTSEKELWKLMEELC